MIRMLLTHGLLFFVPFIAYAVWVMTVRKAKEDKRFRDGPLLWLSIIGIVFVIASLVLLAEVSRAPLGSQYRPAQVIDGEFVPGGYEIPKK
ncbi:DUF6111 family protein [Pseudovibrio sp. Tun.PSC04-5.I4]|uniref:DUF6111 family protein n=1 Tax=Pseudovibrio sp. Tun.PSC04-5.I4 TaxID=1798213 RepID=UPI00088649AA|nr:DUF6111 family protein [Pseudovibrio sp. Tun.PSC04-5.I4]SDR34025.1 hypothetical protein SAMN04515695_4688 [Pseudovibrio sp. Tun.PSC04-5.I4]